MNTKITYSSLITIGVITLLLFFGINPESANFSNTNLTAPSSSTTTDSWKNTYHYGTTNGGKAVTNSRSSEYPATNANNLN